MVSRPGLARARNGAQANAARARVKRRREDEGTIGGMQAPGSGWSPYDIAKSRHARRAAMGPALPPGPWPLSEARRDHLGMSTVSITWITPLDW
ncbi:hypothetical protein MyNCGM683_07750 [Achromobacter xylosoxidans]